MYSGQDKSEYEGSSWNGDRCRGGKSEDLDTHIQIWERQHAQMRPRRMNV